MKVPMRFQLTEFDCGTISLENAISYLYEREEIPAALIKAISSYTLDCYDDNGNIGQGGTSVEAMNLFFHWINEYVSRHDFDLKCTHYKDEYVTLNVIKKCIDEDGCALLRTYLDGDHYVIITMVNTNYVYMFDPYYLDENYKENGVEIIFDKPLNYNRKIEISKFMSANENFSLGPIIKRECLTFSRRKQKEI